MSQIIIDKLFSKLKELNIDDESHKKYLDEEIKHFSMMNAWSLLEDIEGSVNSNNILSAYLLGISKFDPLSPRCLVPCEDGMEDRSWKSFNVVMSTGFSFVVHETSWVAVVPSISYVYKDFWGRSLNVKSGKLGSLPVLAIRPGTTIDGKEGFVKAVLPCSGTKWKEVQCESDKMKYTREDGVSLRPMIGRHFFVQTNEFPDIDVDYTPEALDKIIPWAKSYFGEDNVVGVATYSRFGIKSLFKDICRVFEIPLNEVNIVSGDIPEDAQKLKVTDADFNEKWDEIMDQSEKLKLFREKYEEQYNILSIMKRMHGRIRQTGKHASAMIISSVPLSGKVPLISADDHGTRIPLSAWAEGQDASDLSKFGFVKFDRLGLKTLSYISSCVELLYERGKLDRENGIFKKQPTEHDEESAWMFDDWSSDEFINDKDVLEAASNGDTVGCFQFESDGIRSLLKDIHADSFEELTATNAMFRPGVLQAVVDGIKGGDKVFIKRKNKEMPYTIPEAIEPYLRSTYGLLIYQEQVMQVLNKLGGIPMTECEAARKAISKKKVDVLNKYKKMFIENATLNSDMTKEEAEKYFDDNIVTWSGYGFNKSHAFAYALVAAQTLYLKRKYPIEFYCAFLNNPDDDKMQLLVANAHAAGVRVRGVNINKSKDKFTIATNKSGQEYIVYGLTKVKKVGGAVIEKIIAGQPYSSFKDFLERGCKKKDVVTNLIWAGAFNQFSKNKKALESYFIEEWEPIAKKKVGVILLKKLLKDPIWNMGKDRIKEVVDVFKESCLDKDPENETSGDVEEEMKKKAKPAQMLPKEFREFVHEQLSDTYIMKDQIDEVINDYLADVEPVDFEKSKSFQLPFPYEHETVLRGIESYGLLPSFLNPVYTRCQEHISYAKDFGSIINCFTNEFGEKEYQYRLHITGYVESITQRSYKNNPNKKYHVIKVNDGIDSVNITAFNQEWDALQEPIKLNTIWKFYVSKNKYGFSLASYQGYQSHKL
jgi:ribosomal protein S9